MLFNTYFFVCLVRGSSKNTSSVMSTAITGTEILLFLTSVINTTNFKQNNNEKVLFSWSFYLKHGMQNNFISNRTRVALYLLVSRFYLLQILLINNFTLHTRHHLLRRILGKLRVYGRKIK